MKFIISLKTISFLEKNFKLFADLNNGALSRFKYSRI